MYLEYKPAYFYPQDKVFRDIYSGGYITLGEIGYFVNCNYFLWLESGYFRKEGTINGIDLNVKSTITQVPLALGLGYAYQIKPRFDMYVKIAPNYLYTNTSQKSPFLEPKISKHTAGVTFGLGGKIKFSWFLVDLFANYRYDKKTVHDYISDITFHRYLGGFDFGVGIGGRF
jgi:hypothetical protein